MSLRSGVGCLARSSDIVADDRVSFGFVSAREDSSAVLHVHGGKVCVADQGSYFGWIAAFPAGRPQEIPDMRVAHLSIAMTAFALSGCVDLSVFDAGPGDEIPQADVTQAYEIVKPLNPTMPVYELTGENYGTAYGPGDPSNFQERQRPGSNNSATRSAAGTVGGDGR